MRSSLSSRASQYLAPLVLLPLAAGIAYSPTLGCSSDDSTPAAADAGSDAGADATTGDDDDDDASYPPNDASAVCQIDDDGDDPVALCTQKTILQAWKTGARLSNGVAAAWSVTTGLPVTDGGVLTRDVHAELAYGAAIANYHLAATCYGDTTLTATLDADLLKLEPTIAADFATLPAEYGGDTYFHLRRVAAGLRYQNQTSQGDAIDRIADAYGAAIAQTYFRDNGAVVIADAGADGGDAGDAGADGGDAGAPLDDAAIGVVGSGGVVAYSTVDAASGALALLDLASRHTGDNPGQAALWERDAIEALDHLYNRARDVSGFYYAGGSTIPSDAGTGDTPTDVPTASGYTFTSDVEGKIAEIFLQASDLATANTALTTAGSYPLAARGQAVFALLVGTPSLYDATNLGFYASITPTTGTVDKTKTTVSNAALFGFLGDDRSLGASLSAPQQYTDLSTIIANTSYGKGFLGVVLGQNAYVPASTAAFASVAASDASYTSRDTSAALDALARQLPDSCGD